MSSYDAQHIADLYLTIIVGDAYADLLDALQAAHRSALHNDRETIMNLWGEFVTAYSSEASTLAQSAIIQNYQPRINALIVTCKQKSDSVKSLFVQTQEA